MPFFRLSECVRSTNSTAWLQPTSCRPKAMASCHFWAWGFCCAKTPGIGYSRHPADGPRAGPPLFSPARTPFHRLPWGMKCADVDRETETRGALFPCRQGPRIFTGPRASGKNARPYAHPPPAASAGAGGKTGENIWNSPPQRTKGTRRRILLVFPGISPGPGEAHHTCGSSLRQPGEVHHARRSS
jgi:hypothetical protein